MALASLANGAALVLHIVGGLPMPGLLAATWTIALMAVVGMAAVAGSAARAVMIRTEARLAQQSVRLRRATSAQ